MSALPRPDLPPGPHRDLVDALHDLHHRAGWPSLRALARDTGVSHTTVSKAMSAPALPPWGTLALLVEAMDGDIDRFHDLWVTASTPIDGAAPLAPRIAGRRAELAAVRRHLETGTGLLLVTGEAGIGKTTLVRAAVEATDVFVATGQCRPLSTPVPLLPLAELLREFLTADGGAWFEAALAACPAYVAPALGLVLPELGVPLRDEDSPDFARQRLMGAVTALLSSLGSTRPTALLLEDLPWADTSTLDVLAVLAQGRTAIPLVATWRTEDPDVSESSLTWRRLVASRVHEVRLEPLTRDETADQLALLVGHEPRSDEVDRIYRRSRGQPLFTEQLGSTGASPGPLPEALEHLLVQRLDRLGDDAWQLMRALGVADRPLGIDALLRVADVDLETVSTLRGLARQRLIVHDGDTVAIRHPLIAEAVRGQLVPGEAAGVHRRVAELLSALPDPPAGEIAEHWRSVGDVDQELSWRVRAARAAEARFARREAYPEWARTLELWARSTVPDDDRDIDLAEVHVRTIEAAIGAGLDVDAVRRLIDAAMLVELPEQGHAEVLLRAGDLECAFGDVGLGLRLIDEAVAINERHPPTAQAGHVLEVRANIHASLGHNAELRVDVARGLAVAAAVGAPALHRRMLNLSAWQHLVDGDPEGARQQAARARAAIPASEDPAGAVRIASLEAEILLQTGASAAEVVAATADAAAQADLWGFENIFADSLYASLCEAHLRAGDVAAAWALVEPRVADRAGADFSRTQTAWCSVQVARGNLAAALERLEDLASVYNYDAGSVVHDQVRAIALVWAGRPEDAIDCLDRARAFVSTNDLANEAAALLATRARAETDLAEATGRDPAVRRADLRRLERLRSMWPADPFGPKGIGADRAAYDLLWHAELARLIGEDAADEWARAASGWDKLTRPHDVAYCRWRAAQVALRDGRGTLAARLLRRAAADAREHVPLSEAIAATRASAY